MKLRKYKFFYFVILISLFSVLLTSCSRQTNPVTKTGFYFNTVISISLYDSKDTTLLDDCFSLADSYEKMFSKTVEGSDIWKINHSAGSPVGVTEETAFLLQKALDYAALTEGVVDPTIGSVSELWNFSENTTGELPNPQELEEALTHVNYKNISISDLDVTLSDKKTKLDLGFIAKGYIADRMKEYLLSKGVKSALINLGGNVLVIGEKPDKTPFRLGVQKPFAPEGTPLTTIPVIDCSVVSSGNYERYFDKDGKIYHHILDSKTGYPIWNNLSEVTILSNSSTDGDALSTACFALGLEKGMALIESLEEIEAIFVETDYTLHYTSGLQNLSELK